MELSIRHGFELDTHDLLELQVFARPTQNPIIGPAVHSRVNVVPIAESLRQSSPFAALFGDIQNGIEHLPVLNVHTATLDRRDSARRVLTEIE